MTELVVTYGKVMREAREQGTIVPFPSGNNYRVRVPGAAGLLKRGNLPNLLTNYCVSLFYDGDPEGKKHEAFTATADHDERALEVIAAYDTVCREMFIEPHIVDNPQADDEIGIDDIPMRDKHFAFRIAFLEVDALKVFREQPQSDVERVDEPQDVPQTAIAGA